MVIVGNIIHTPQPFLGASVPLKSAVCTTSAVPFLTLAYSQNGTVTLRTGTEVRT